MMKCPLWDGIQSPLKHIPAAVLDKYIANTAAVRVTAPWTEYCYGTVVVKYQSVLRTEEHRIKKKTQQEGKNITALIVQLLWEKNLIVISVSGVSNVFFSLWSHPKMFGRVFFIPPLEKISNASTEHTGCMSTVRLLLSVLHFNMLFLSCSHTSAGEASTQGTGLTNRKQHEVQCLAQGAVDQHKPHI